MSQKSVKNYFRHNFVKFPPNIKSFGTKMAIDTKLGKAQNECSSHKFILFAIFVPTVQSG